MSRSATAGSSPTVTLTAALTAAMTEDELLTWILDLAGWTKRWRVFHVRDSKRGVIQGPGCKGFPDLVLSGGGSSPRILYRELKNERDDLRLEQLQWRDALVLAGADWDLWRPSDMRAIEALLTA